MASEVEKREVLRKAYYLTAADQEATRYAKFHTKNDLRSGHMWASTASDVEGWDKDEACRLESEVDTILKDLINFCVNIGSDN